MLCFDENKWKTSPHGSIDQNKMNENIEKWLETIDKNCMTEQYKHALNNLLKTQKLKDGRISKNFRLLTLIRESWKKNPKRGTVTESVLRKKNPERSMKKICICFCALDFFSGKHSRSRSQKMAYIFVQHGISALILAYAI